MTRPGVESPSSVTQFKYGRPCRTCGREFLTNHEYRSLCSRCMVYREKWQAHAREDSYQAWAWEELF